MIGYNIPAGLPIKEHFRLLAYLKNEYKNGFFDKGRLGVISKAMNKDKRTVLKDLSKLLDEGLIGEDETIIYLRKWSFILSKIKSKTIQAIRMQPNELTNKTLFELILFSAKIKVIEKAAKFRSRELSWGCSNQIEISTGLLSSICNISFGKVSKIKQLANNQGFIKSEKNITLLETSPIYLKYIGDISGVFIRGGKVFKRGIDKIISFSETYKKRNWKSYKPKKPNKTLH